MGNYVYSQPKPHGVVRRDLLLNLHKNDGKAMIYQPHSLILKKKKVLFMSKTIKKEEDSDDEKKPKEKKKTIKFDFLPDGIKYKLTLIADGSHDKDFLTRYLVVDKSSSVEVKLLRRGGFVMSLTPLN